MGKDRTAVILTLEDGWQVELAVRFLAFRERLKNNQKMVKNGI